MDELADVFGSLAVTKASSYDDLAKDCDKFQTESLKFKQLYAKSEESLSTALSQLDDANQKIEKLNDRIVQLEGSVGRLGNGPKAIKIQRQVS